MKDTCRRKRTKWATRSSRRFTVSRLKHSFILWLIPTYFSAQSVVNIGNTPVVIDTIVTNIDVPWEIQYGPDGFIWATERKGIVSHTDPVQRIRTVILDIQSQVYQADESGLLGMALHPDFVNVPQVFLVYTYGVQPQVKERLVRYTYSGGVLINPVILLDSISATNAHDGSRLMFLPDNTLLMTTGDAHVDGAPQSTTALNGKVLRMNMDGSVPADNPFPGSRTFTFGHRNTQGLVRAPWGTVYVSEHGTAIGDEFQKLEKGRNYGWPDVEGFCDTPAEIAFCSANNVKEPIIEWTPSIAPNDLIYYQNNSFPEFDGKFIMTTLKSKRLVAIKLNYTGEVAISQANYLDNMFGRLRDICVGQNGQIFLATNGADPANIDPYQHSILVLTPPSPTLSVAAYNASDIQVYPTPAHEKVTIETVGDDQLDIEITDLTGSQLAAQRCKGKCSLNVEGLAPGCYVLKVMRAGQSAWRKIVVY